MAKISDSKGRSDENSGYFRLFGIQALGKLTSRVHSAVIRTGNDLERLIKAETPDALIAKLENILAGQKTFNSIQVVFQAKMPPRGKERGERADIVIFNHGKQKAIVIELKDGDTFDTKKASGELASMTAFASWLTEELGYETDFFFCSFNQNNKEAIVAGAKGRFSISHAMTGRELCTLLSIDYDALLVKRKKEQPENVRYYVSELLKIDEIRKLIKELWKNNND